MRIMGRMDSLISWLHTFPVKFLPLLRQIIFNFGLISHNLYPDWSLSFFSVNYKTFEPFPEDL